MTGKGPRGHARKLIPREGRSQGAMHVRARGWGGAGTRGERLLRFLCHSKLDAQLLKHRRLALLLLPALQK